MSSSSYIGIDIAKATLAVSTTDSYLGEFANTAQGHATLLERLESLQVALVTMEETGIYGRSIAALLQQHGYTIASVPPDRVRSYAKARGTLAKTDPIDARMIALFGQAMQPRHATPRDEKVDELRALLDRRHQLVHDRTQERNRREACQNTGVIRLIKLSIDRLNKEIDAIDQLIATTIQQHEPFQRMAEILLAIDGVGMQTAATVIGMIPEIGRLNRQQIAKLIGVSPHDQSSGTHDGQRHIRGGRSRARKVLYMAGLSAARHNDALKKYYTGLLQRGKAKKVAIIACTRKLLVYINTLMKEFHAESCIKQQQASP